MKKVIIIVLIVLAVAGGVVGALFAFGVLGGGDDDKVVCENHTWTLIEGSKKEATCTKTGTASYKCKFCDEEKTETLPMKAHALDTIYAKAPTCTQAGNTEGQMCDNRGCDYMVGNEYLPKLGHTEVSTPGKTATCTEKGYSADGTHCEVCMTVITAPSEIYPATGHTYVDAEDVPATCAAPGYIGGDVCKDCGHRGSKPYETIPQLTEHSAEFVVANYATCTTDGYMKCPVCNYQEKFEDKNPDLHQYAVKTAAVAPNCLTKTDGATAVMECTSPGCGLTVGGNAISWEKCHEDGSEYCTIAWETEFEPTETSAGVKHGVCSGCQKTFTEDIPPITDDNFEEDNNIYPDDIVGERKSKKKKAA